MHPKNSTAPTKTCGKPQRWSVVTGSDTGEGRGLVRRAVETEASDYLLKGLLLFITPVSGRFSQGLGIGNVDKAPPQLHKPLVL
jgi:hypothetical protein